MLNAFLVLDFDSTLLSVAPLLVVVLLHVPNKEESVTQGYGITRAGMEGRIGFDESL